MRDIPGYEGLYAVTSCGKVWSHRRKRFLKPITLGAGYSAIRLCVNREIKLFYIHRLVALAYIPNPDNLPEVNHIDEVKSHNWVSNLEWTTHKDNINHGTCIERRAQTHSIPVYCVELDRVFEGAAAAARELGLNRANITTCCKGKAQTCGKYHWRYAEKNELE